MTIIIHFGKKSYRVAFSQWDDARHAGLIQVYDEEGNPAIVESAGLAPYEIRAAVASYALRKARPCFDCDDDGYCTMNCGPAVSKE